MGFINTAAEKSSSFFPHNFHGVKRDWTLYSAENCCVFKTHSALGSLPREFISHFPSSHMDWAPPRRENKYIHSDGGTSGSSQSNRLPQGPLSPTEDFDIHTHRQTSSGWIRHSLSEEQRYDLHCEALSVTATVRCTVIHCYHCVLWVQHYVCFSEPCVFWCRAAAFLDSVVGWLAECAVSGFKKVLLPCGSYCLFAWTQSFFSWIYNSRHWSAWQFVVAVTYGSC